MSNPTSNFGWVMPTSTDLVTDLPADFAVFGQGVDTTMADLKGGTSGQILSKASNTDMDFTWIANDQGDITAVNVTSPITGGGSAGAVTVGIQDASTSQKGSVQLSDSTSTTSSVLAATPTAVKSSYDLAAAAVPKSTATAKGSIFTATASATPAELAVGSNGSTLVADSSTSTGLRYTSNFAAGKNKIINGDFFVNQRGFTSESNGTNYVADRWKYAASTTGTASINVFTPGTAPVAGYEGKNYLRMVTSGQSGTTAQAQFATRVEDVRTFAGQTTTLSFWAKASSGTPYVAADWLQLFGTGGSSAVVGTGQKTAITTSWARYSFIFAIDSVAGKTISTSNDSSVQIEIWTSAGTDYNTRAASMGIQSTTIDIWGVQWEAGSVATAFQTATGTLQGELAACQRYYEKSYAQATAPATATFTGCIDKYIGVTVTGSGDQLYYRVTKRTAPTVTIYSASTGTSGKVWNNSAAVDVTITGGSNGESGYSFYWTQTSGGLNASYHYVASAEL